MVNQSIDVNTADRQLPPDELSCDLIVASPDDPTRRSVTMNGSISTILVSGSETDQRYCLIDMLIPEGGGAPPHRHDFEEVLTVFEGTILFTFRGHTSAVSAPATICIPPNAPHSFKNASGNTVHLLCMCMPAGIEDFFLAAAEPIESRKFLPPRLTNADRARRAKQAMAMAPRYRMEFLA